MVSLLKAKNKDTMAEDLILLFLVTVLLVATVGTTREHMTEQAQAPAEKESYNKMARALAKLGPSGTFAAFESELKKQEDILLRTEEE